MGRASVLIFGGFLTATAWLTGVAPAGATHDGACNAMPTSAQRPGQVSCNPRQDCINKIPGNVHGPTRSAAEQTCNRLPDQGSCPGMVSFNPRQECLAKLPQPPALKVDGVEGSGYASDNAVKNIRSDQWLVVRGRNVGLQGNRVSGQQGDFTVKRGSRPGCSGNDCLAIEVQANAKWLDICEQARAQRSFVITELTGHNWARGEFRIGPYDLHPRPPKLGDPQTTDLIRAIVLYPIEATESDRNLVVVKVPPAGEELMVEIKPANTGVRPDPHWFAVTASTVRTGTMSRPLAGAPPGSTVALDFKLVVSWHGRPCDERSEGIVDVNVTAHSGKVQEKATGQVWIRPRQ